MLLLTLSRQSQPKGVSEQRVEVILEIMHALIVKGRSFTRYLCISCFEETRRKSFLCVLSIG